MSTNNLGINTHLANKQIQLLRAKQAKAEAEFKAQKARIDAEITALSSNLPGSSQFESSQQTVASASYQYISVPPRPAKKRAASGISSQLASDSFSTQVDDYPVLNLEHPHKKRQLNYSKCSFCREAKQKCSPVEREWPGKKCDRCTEKSLPCSAPEEVGKGRPRAQQPSIKFSAANTANISDKGKPDLLKWIHRISYCQMLAGALKTFRRLTKNNNSLLEVDEIHEVRRLTKNNNSLLEKDDIVEDELLSHGAIDATGERRRRQDFYYFMTNFCYDTLYTAEKQLHTIPTVPWMCEPTASPAMLSILLTYMFCETECSPSAPNDVQKLRESGDLGTAVMLQTELSARKTGQFARDCLKWDFEDFDFKPSKECNDDWKLLVQMRLEFQLIATKLLDEYKNCKIPSILQNMPFPIPESLFGLVPLDLFLEAGWKMDCLGRTLLHIVLDVGNKQLFSDALHRSSWLESENIIDCQDVLGRSALHIACEKGYWEAVEALVNRGATLDLKTGDGLQPLHYAAAIGHLSICRFLLSKKDIDPDAPDFFKRAPIFYAILAKKEALVQLFLDQKNVEINRVDFENQTPLSAAAKRGNLRAVESLLDHGADANHHVTSNETPFSLSVRGKHLEIMKLLGARKDVDANMRDNDLIDLLGVSVRVGFTEGFQYLLDRVDVDMNDDYYYDLTLLRYAVSCGQAQIIKVLGSNRKVDLNFMNRSGECALSDAVYGGHTQIVEILLSFRDIDVNIIDSDHEMTPIMIAAMKGNDKIAKLLLTHPNIDLSLKGIFGRTAIMIAAMKGNDKIAKLLLTHPSIDLSLKDMFGHTAVDNARLKGHDQLADFLQEEMLRISLEKGNGT